MTTQRCCENCECPFVSFRSECPRKFCSGGCHEKDCSCHQQDKSVCEHDYQGAFYRKCTKCGSMELVDMIETMTTPSTNKCCDSCKRHKKPHTCWDCRCDIKPTEPSVCFKCGEEIPSGKTYKRNEDGTIQHAPGDYCQPSVCEHEWVGPKWEPEHQKCGKCGVAWRKVYPKPSVAGEIEWEKRPYETYEAHLSRIIPRLVEVLNKRTNER